jgi:F0F1-type ATP synthase assembly protein I
MPNDPVSLNDPASSNDAAAPRQTEMTRSLHRSSGSFELAFAPVLLALLGLWIDTSAGTMPLFTITLAAVGVVGAGIKTYYSYNHSMQQLAQDGTLVPERPARQYHARNRTEQPATEQPATEQPATGHEVAS